MMFCRSLWLFMVVGMQTLGGPIETMAAETPCPDVFQYFGNQYGIITVPNPYPYLAIDITVEIYITAPVPPNRKAKLELVDANTWQKLAAGNRDPIMYRLEFPLTSPLPSIKSITVNQEVICRGSRPSASFLTTLSIQQAIYNEKCFSSSLDCPDNIQKALDKYERRPPPLQPPKDDIVWHTQEDPFSTTSPCPDVFKYQLDRSGVWYGIISVPNPYPVVAIDIKVQLYITTITPERRKGNLQLVNNLNDEWQRMRTGEQYSIPYRLDFPVSSPLPTIKSITVNDKVLCRGNKPDTLELTTHSFQHGIFSEKCTSSSLECPFNIEQNVEPIRPNPPINMPAPTEKPPTTQKPRPPTSRPQPQPQPQPPIQQPSINRNTQCGSPVVRTNPLIIKGQNTSRGQWPWHIALYHHIGYDTVYKCGGSFIGTKTIITAAHCVTKGGEMLSPRDFIVYLGRYNLRDRKEDFQESDVSRIFVHPSFNSSRFQADLALLILANSVQYTVNVRPLCLWDQRDTNLANVVGKNGVVVGWGLDENGQTAQRIKMVKMPIVNQTTCLWSQPTFFSQFTSNTTFCAGFRNGSSVCNGDSGSGMVFPESQSNGIQIWKLRGIVSNSRPNDNDNRICDPNSFIVFTDIAQYLDWINTLII